MHSKLFIFLLSTSIVYCAKAQSVYNVFETKDNKKILDWIAANPKASANVLSDRISVFFNNRYPTNKLNCVAEQISVLELAIFFENQEVVAALLKKKEIADDKSLLSQALNFAVFKNNESLVSQLLAQGAEVNRPSAYFFGQNTLQIALTNNVKPELTDLIAQKSKPEDFNFSNCIGRSVLHDLAESGKTAFFKKHATQFNQSLFLGGESLEYPIEIAIKKGNLELIKPLWTAMSATQQKISEDQFRRLKFHAILSKNPQTNYWVDSVIVKNLKLDKKEVNSFVASSTPFDLTLFLDETLIYRNNFLDLSQTTQNLSDKNFLDFLKNYQLFLQTKFGIAPITQPTYHGVTKLIPMQDAAYISHFFVTSFWNNLAIKKISYTEIGEWEKSQDAFFTFIETKMPGQFQGNFSVDFELFTSYLSADFDVLAYVLSNLNIQHLRVKNVNNAADYKFVFPKLEYLDIQWTDETTGEFHVGHELMSLREMKFQGLDTITFPPKIEAHALQVLHIESGAYIDNLPKGVKINYY